MDESKKLPGDIPKGLSDVLNVDGKTRKLTEGAGQNYNKEIHFTQWDMIVPAGASIQLGGQRGFNGASEEISFTDPIQKDVEGNNYIIIINLKRGTIRRGINYEFLDQVTDPGFVAYGNKKTFNEFRDELPADSKKLPILGQTVPIDWDMGIEITNIESFFKNGDQVIGDSRKFQNLMYIIDFDEGTLTLKEKPPQIRGDWEEFDPYQLLKSEIRENGFGTYEKFTLIRLAEMTGANIAQHLRKTKRKIKNIVE